MNMTAEQFSFYRRGMDVLEAQDRLMDLRIACSPYLKHENLQKLERMLERSAQIKQPEPQEMTPDMIARLLNG